MLPQRGLTRYARQDKFASLFVLYDGGCPLCAFEIHHMQRFAATRAAPVAFVDIFSSSRSSSDKQQQQQQELELAPLPEVVRRTFDLTDELVIKRLMYRMHAIQIKDEQGQDQQQQQQQQAQEQQTAAVTILRGPHAFRAMYRHAGWLFSHVAALTEHPLIARHVDKAYDWFASNRHRFVPR